MVADETKSHKKIPEITNFSNADSNDTIQTEIDRNYKQFKQYVFIQ